MMTTVAGQIFHRKTLFCFVCFRCCCSNEQELENRILTENLKKKTPLKSEHAPNE